MLKPNTENKIQTLQKENEQLHVSNEKLQAENERLREYIRLALLRRFASKSEKINPNQPSLFNEVEELAIPEEPVETEQTPAPKKKRKKRRISIPAFIPREMKVHDLPEEEKFCSHHQQPLVKIGEDISEQLSIVPAQIFAVQHVRPKYACPDCEEQPVRQEKMPVQPIPGSIASASLLAYLIVSKYLDHLPLYRLQAMFLRIGIVISRFTMARWMIRVATTLEPLYHLLEKELLASPHLFMDETPVQVLAEPERKPEQKSYMWVRARDATYGSPIVLYHYAPSRGNEVAASLLTGFRGVLQTDGYPAYNMVCLRDKLLHAGCWNHCRRKFWEADKAAKKKQGTLAHEALEIIRSLYDVERKTCDMTLEERLVYRKIHMTPLVNKFKAWLDDNVDKTPPSLLTGKAIAYTLGQWDKLLLVLQFGYVSLDTNFVENKIRPFALGRKNWLFSQSVAGAKASAILYSFVITAKENGLDPYQYLCKTLESINHTSSSDELRQLLPFQQNTKLNQHG
jgi:transposase